MKIIRSSDIGTFLYCRRAWWYGEQGVPSESEAEMEAGYQYHQRHGRRVLAAGLARLSGIVFLLAAVVLLVVAFMLNWLG